MRLRAFVILGLAMLIALTTFPAHSVIDADHGSLIVSIATDSEGNVPEFSVAAEVTLDTDPPSATFTPPDGSDVSKPDIIIIADYDEVVTPIEALFGQAGATQADVLAELQITHHRGIQ